MRGLVAPRVPGESVGSRRLSHMVVRPLNFTAKPQPWPSVCLPLKLAALVVATVSPSLPPSSGLSMADT